MPNDLIRYDLLVQNALRGVVRKVLTDVVRDGLPGSHHFYISFRTDEPRTRVSERLREKYPEEMTIVLQHEFWDLVVNDRGFEVGLSFSKIPERLFVPYEAITAFFDPSVQFGLKFETKEDAAAAAGGTVEAAAKGSARTPVAIDAPPAEREEAARAAKSEKPKNRTRPRARRKRRQTRANRSLTRRIRFRTTRPAQRSSALMRSARSTKNRQSVKLHVRKHRHVAGVREVGMKLYYSPGACSLGIHVLLEEIGKPYDLQKLNFQEQEQYKPDFTKINPKSKVPTLQRDDGSILTEFPAIATWLARKNPEKGLVPNDPDGEARVLEALDYIVATLHMQGFGRMFRPVNYAPSEADHDKVKARGKEIFENGLKLLDKALAGKQFLGGDKLSIADAALFYVSFWGAGRMKLTLPPNVAAHYARMKQRPAVQRALEQEGLAQLAAAA